MPTNEENSSIVARILNHLLNVNLFSTNDGTFVDQRLATRLYLALVFTGAFAVLLFSGFSVQTSTIMVRGNPLPLSLVERLQNEFSITLSCPCSQTSIRRDRFLSFTPEYHPVCSSALVQPEWIESLTWANNRTRFYHPLDFRLVASSQFAYLALLCRTTATVIDDARYGEFASTLMITPQLTTPAAFKAEVSAILQQFRVNTVTSLLRTDQLLFAILQNDVIVSALRTNFFTTMVPGSPDFYTYWAIYSRDPATNETDPYTISVPYCECVWTFDCTFPAALYNETLRAGVGGLHLPQPPPLSVVPGMLTGCTVRNSLLQSTLVCFFDSACVGMLGGRFNETILSTTSRFLTNTTVEVLFRELFLESLHDASDYASYFTECAPSMCTYLYSRRFDILHMITTVTSVFGGFCVIFRFLSPYMIKLYRRIIPTPTVNDNQETIGTEQSIELTTRGRQFYGLLRQKLLTMDFFEFDDIRLGIISTRVYVVLLLIGVLLFSIYTSLAADLYVVTLYSPTLNEFETAELSYPSSLVCSCSHLSIGYNQIMHVQPRYHQLCSSAFLTDTWLAYFDLGPNARMLAWNPSDFRLAGQGFFVLLQVLCMMAEEVVNTAVANFNATDLITRRVLARADFKAETDTILTQFELQTVASFMWLFELLRISIRDNQLFSGTSAGAIFVQDENHSVQFSPVVDATSCSCGTSTECGGLYGFFPIWIAGMPLNGENIVQPISGLAGACFPVEAALHSNLECLYTPSCLALLMTWRSFNITNLIIKPLEPATQNIPPLNADLPSRFVPNSSIGMIAAQLFIEEWLAASDYEEYYRQCAPSECTYTYTRGFDVLHVITSLIGIWTGLTLCLRLIVPLGVTFMLKTLSVVRSNEQRTDPNAVFHRGDLSHSMVSRSLSRQLRKLWSAICSCNVFSKVPSMTVAMQRMTTRLYFLLLNGCLVCVLLFVSFRQRTHTETVLTPNAALVEALYQTSTLSSLTCPCSQNSVPYDMFLSISAVRHNICTSAFVTTPWWRSIFNRSDSDQSLFSSHIRLLSSMCELTKNIIDNAIAVFAANKLITFDVVPRNTFTTRTDTILATFLKQAPVNFRQALAFIDGNFRSNQLMTVLSSNWQIELSNAEEQYLISTSPHILSIGEQSSSCSCASSAACAAPLVFSTNRSFPGLLRGCLPIDGLRLSTLECFSQVICLASLLIDLSVDATLFELAPLKVSPTENVTLPAGELIDALFVQEWQTTSNYSNYFSICAPLFCKYSFTRRSAVLDVISTLFGVYGGLTIVLRFLAPITIRTCRKLHVGRINTRL